MAVVLIMRVAVD